MYIYNEELISLIKDYHKDGFISDRLHVLLFNLAKNIGSKSNWKDYSWKEDMISDAYLKCLLKIDKIDTENGNAFSYFTTIIFNFYIDVIKKYKKSKEILKKMKERHIQMMEMQHNVFYNRKNVVNFRNE